MLKKYILAIYISKRRDQSMGFYSMCGKACSIWAVKSIGLSVGKLKEAAGVCLLLSSTRKFQKHSRKQHYKMLIE